MPQGVTNAPSTFQRLMERCMGDMNLKEALVFIDDLIVFAPTLEEHEQRLMKVLHRLKEFGLKLSVEKCVFFQTSVRYLGHVVSSKGVETDPEKIATLTTWPVPKNLKELRSFLGFAGYYRRFVQGYSSVARPLNDLTSGYPPSRRRSKQMTSQHYLNPKEPFADRWTPACQQAFEELIQKLTTAPVLAFADPSKPYILHTDASSTGLGAVLYQEHDGHNRVVAYASRGLSRSESRYSAHKLEFLALKWAVTEKFSDYLYGSDFTVVTDSNPLTYLLTSAKLDATSYRWLSALSTFTFKIVYRSGKLNADADGLSRRPHEEHSEDARSQKERERILRFTEQHLENPACISIDQHSVQAVCDRQLVYSSPDKDQITAFVQALSISADSLPDSFVNDLQFSSPTMPTLSDAEIAAKQRADPVIQHVLAQLERGDTPPPSVREQLPDLPLLLRELQRLELHNDVLVRRRNVNVPTPNQRAKTVAKALWDNFLIHYGIPERLHSDQGPDFESHTIKELCQMAGIHKIHTTPYHPRGNPVERFNRTLLNMLGTLQEQDKTHWKDFVKPLVHAYNCTRNDVTGYSPYELMFGRQPRLPVDLAFGLPVSEKQSTSHLQYIENLKAHLEESYKIATKNAEKVMGRNKSRFDKKVTASELSVGDRVLVRNVKVRGKHKLADRWEPDVYVIEKKAGTLPVYTVKPEGKDHPIRTLHRDLLLPCGFLSPVSKPDKPKLPSVTSEIPTPETPDLQEDNDDPELLDPYLHDLPGTSFDPIRFTTVVELPVSTPPVVPVAAPASPPGQPLQSVIEEDSVVVEHEMSGPELVDHTDLDTDLEQVSEIAPAVVEEPPEERTSSQPECLSPEPVHISSDSESQPEPEISSPESDLPPRRPTRTRQPPNRLQYSGLGKPVLQSIQSLFHGLSTAFASALQLEEMPLKTDPGNFTALPIDLYMHGRKVKLKRKSTEITNMKKTKPRHQELPCPLQTDRHAQEPKTLHLYNTCQVRMKRRRQDSQRPDGSWTVSCD
ncbi:hypothetical protein WMY93_015556 [Mugilogobius chulae]|uniref:ribonuclease H n=1 Tax=Mugilogobius chulae TaxID=88201 RepID=A0AAW0P0K8_9GOBI